MDLDEKIALVKEVGEEILTEGELRELFLKKKHPVAYDGFEPSGRMHIAQGVLRTINVNKMIQAGCKFTMFVADWHAWANNKMGGDLDKIQKVGEYMIEIWKASGMDTKNVEFVWASDLAKDTEYWKKVMQVARHSTLNRVVRCGQIMGRGEKENLSSAQILYPCMQAADIFHLKADITQLGMDQRKVNVLAREIGPKLGYWKPVAVHHHMLMGLSAPPENAGDTVERAIAMKMSKSNPDSAIFMTDTEEDIARKIKKAYCPEKQVEENPIIEYARYMVFEMFGKLSIVRPEKFGGNLEVKNYSEFEKLYSEGKIHPMDLKSSVAKAINEMIKPVREHFVKNAKARKLKELVDGFKVTR
ncbi:MAG: tyrosine--tRNA ligase [Candidatus Aenigmarchaeota archaeon]|nr:tyrosine--tRNA ligase [Candidatus Aenigmarchaeota archaeon]